MTGHKQSTDGNDYTTSYTYKLSGALNEQTYPSGRVVKNELDVSGDLASVTSKENASAIFKTYANDFNYNAAGAVTTLRLGNGRFESTTFNSRLQPTQIGLGTSETTQNILKLEYGYGTTANNGDVISQTITVPTVGSNTGFAAVQTYTYDELNRLKSATENVTPHGGSQSQSWKQTYTFDRYGNRRFDFTGGNTTSPASNCTEAICNPTVNTTNNRLTSTGWQYDNAGNTTRDGEYRTFTYDGENKQTLVKNSSDATIGEYFYDGDGKRVKKSVPSTGETTVFVYDASGKLIGEYSTIVANSTDAKVAYLTNDHLGSPRITTDAIGQTTSRRDFMPYGEEIARSGYGSDSVREKFATYERDNETDLDFAQARMFGSGLGRFTIPDPTLLSVNGHNPQSWNRYLYVLNNPLLYVDPHGLWELRYEIVWKKNKDGSYKYDDGKPILDYVEVTAVKTQGDKDTSARLAEQLGLKGNEAAKFAEKVGNGDNVRLSQQGGEVGRVFTSVESGLKDMAKFAISKPYDVQAGRGPDDADCSETASRIAYPSKMIGIDDYTVGQADELISSNGARSIDSDALRIGDIVRWSSNGNPTHFANFIFRDDSGVPQVFSKSGDRGSYEVAGTSDARWSGYGYGSISGIRKRDSGYYRP